MKIYWQAPPEARIEIANFIRSYASGISQSENIITGEVAKKEIEKIRAIVKILDVLANQIETGEILK